MSRIVILAVSLVFLLVRPAFALDAVEAEHLVRSAITDATTWFAGGGMTREQTRAKVTALVEKYADIGYESEMLLGRYWRKASPEQQKSFSDLLIPYFVATYGEMIDGAPESPKIEFGNTEPSEGGSFLVHTMLRPVGEEPIKLDWNIVTAPSGKVVVADVMADGVAMVTTIKADFTAVIRAGGGKLDPLLVAMRKKITDAENQPSR